MRARSSSGVNVNSSGASGMLMPGSRSASWMIAISARASLLTALRMTTWSGYQPQRLEQQRAEHEREARAHRRDHAAPAGDVHPAEREPEHGRAEVARDER